MDPRHRRITLALFGLAAIGWVAVAVVALTMDPLAGSGGFAGAAALGGAVALTAAPLLWLFGYTRHGRIAYRGEWVKALRRGAWIGILVALFVVMRVNGVFQPQIGLFFVALALVAELTLTAGSAGRT